MKTVEENFKQETMKLVERKDHEIVILKTTVTDLKANQVVIDDEATKRLRIQVEDFKKTLQNNQAAYRDKERQCHDLEEIIREQHQQLFDKEVQMSELLKKHDYCVQQHQKILKDME
jgi:hypothetical protein